MTSISLRPAEEEDLPGLTAFFGERFGRSWTPEEWRWKYQALPGESRSLVAADASGAILAHAGALCLPARWRGGEAGVWQLVDFAGTPRNRGLRPALADLGTLLLQDLPRQGDAPWIFGFPSERHFRLGERIFGYRRLVGIEDLGGSIPGEPVPKDTHVETGDSCGDWAEAVWQACQVASIRRSAAFLNWRYHARPHRYYRFYRLTAGGVEGLAVFAFVGEEAWAAELWLPVGIDWHSSMLAVAADLRASGLRRWRFWPGFQTGGLLASLGLRLTGEHRLIGCRGRAGGADPVVRAAGFFYAMGDYDLI